MKAGVLILINPFLGSSLWAQGKGLKVVTHKGIVKRH
jgi:hypothetical protein